MGLGSFIQNAVKAAGKIAAPVTKPVGNLLKPVTNPLEKAVVNPVLKKVVNPAINEVNKAIEKVQKIPVAGQIFNLTTGVHLFEGADRVLKGERIDRAALKTFKAQLHEYTQLAPYAASVVSFVPGVGPGIGSAMAAAGALAEGRPLSEVALAAVKGAIPGGAIAQAAFDVAQAAAAGKPVEQVVIAGLPVDNKTKQAIAAAAALTKDLANGKRLDKALVNRIDDAMRLLPPDIAKAVNIGNAVGLAQGMQRDMAKALTNPNTLKAIADVGKAASLTDKVLSEARKINSNINFTKGFDLAAGLMKGKGVNPTIIGAARKMLKGDLEKKGFDAAMALQIGRVKRLGKKNVKPSTPKHVKRLGKKVHPKQSAAHAITLGIAGALPSQKVGIVKELAVDPTTRAGAADAIRQVAASRDNRTIWDIIKQIFGFGR